MESLYRFSIVAWLHFYCRGWPENQALGETGRLVIRYGTWIITYPMRVRLADVWAVQALCNPLTSIATRGVSLYFGSTSGFSKIILPHVLRSHNYFTHFTYSRFHLRGLVIKFTISSNIHRLSGASRITTILISSLSRITTQPELISDMQVASNIPREAFPTFR